jgi:DNA-binding FadR family transcriptional regulator
MRNDALDHAEGELLGSEQELLDRYGVSRPTLRQAAALVAQENLLSIRRGVRGGYFVARPDSRAVAHVAAVFLRSRHTSQLEIINAVEPLRIELAKLAASCRDAELRAKLAQFLANQEVLDPESLRFKDFARSEREFGTFIGEMSGNSVLSLFLNILYDFSGMVTRNEDFFRNRPDRVEVYRTRRNQLAKAILDSDEELAVLAAKRCRVIFDEAVEDTEMADDGGKSELLEFLTPHRNPTSRNAYVAP